MTVCGFPIVCMKDDGHKDDHSSDPMWHSTDPLHDLVGRKRANIIILRPSLTGHHYDAGTGYCEMKHGWHVATSFTGEESRIIDKWDQAWLWCLSPKQF